MFFGLEHKHIVINIANENILLILFGGLAVFFLLRYLKCKVNPVLFFIIYLFPVSGMYFDVGFHLFYYRILMIGYFVFWIFKKAFKPDNLWGIFNNTTMTVFFFLLACLPGLSLCLSYTAFFRWWFAILAGVLLYIIVLDEVGNLKQVEDLIFTCIVTGFIWSVTGLVLFVKLNTSLNIADIRQIYRISGLNSDPNFFAAILIGYIQLAFFWVIKKQNHYRLFSFIALFAMLTAFIFTYSRGAYLGFILTVLLNIICFFSFRTKLATLVNLKKNILFLFLVLMIMSSSVFMFSSVSNRITSLSTDKTGSGRIVVWKDAISVVVDNPLGVGLNNFTSYTIRHKSKYRAPGSSVHNAFLQLLAETGVVGFLSYVLFLGTIVFKIRYVNSFSDPQLVFWFVGLFISFTGILFCSLFITNFYTENIFIIIALFLATLHVSQANNNLKNLASI